MQKFPAPLKIASLFSVLLLSALPGHTASLSLADLRPGDLQITEYLANPIVLADSANEYFEIFNQREQAVSLNGLIVRDEGSNEFTIVDLVIPGRGFSVLSNGDGSQLGIRADYQYGNAMALTNSADEILLLTPGAQLLAALRFSDGDFFGAGVAHELIQGDRSLSEALGPSLGGDYQAASATLAAGNLGSPGRGGNTRFSAPVVPVPAALWLFGSGLAALAGLRRRILRLAR